MIELKNVSKVYNNKKVLNDISFSIHEGESVGIIGNNGSGKTTLIKILSNLISYNNGEVNIFNKNLSYKTHSYKKRVGLILNEPYYIEELNTVDYLKFVAKFQSVQEDDNTLNKKIFELIELLQITDRNKKIIKLSSGNQRKVSIAGSLIHNPELLIYDEPFINLDIKSLKSFKELILKFKNKKTIVITSHNLDLVIDLCDRYIIIDEGVLIEDIHKKSYESIESLKKDVYDKMT